MKGMCWGVISAFIAACMTAYAAQTAAPSGVEPEIVRFIAEKVRINQESLRTWRGNVSLAAYHGKSSQRYVPNSPTQLTKLEFVYDAEGARARWDGTLTRFSSGADGIESTEKAYGYMYDTKGVYELERPGDAENAIICYVRPPQDKRRMGAAEFDVDSVFRPWNMTLMSLYENLVQGLKQPDSKYYLERTGDKVTFGQREPSGIVNEFVCDLSMGGNIVSFKAIGPDKTGEVWTAQYVEINGVWVPRLKTVEWDDANGDLTFKVETAFQDMATNTPVSPDDFTLEKIGIKVGDPVLDNRLGIQYSFGTVPPETLPEPDTAMGLLKGDLQSSNMAAETSDSGVAAAPATTDVTAEKGESLSTAKIWAGAGLLVVVAAVLTAAIRQKLKSGKRGR